MYLMFLLAINIGALRRCLMLAPWHSLSMVFSGLAMTLHFPDWLTIFLAQGLGGGINTVLPLVPQIGMMYLFLSFLEDLATAGARRICDGPSDAGWDLLGKSFVPLINGALAVTYRQ